MGLFFACNAVSDTGEGPADQDNDSISDTDETRSLGIDTDADGIPDFLDLDSDGDGVLDAAEAGDTDGASPPIDSDGDTLPDFRDTDSDDNGRPDGADGTADTDGDMIHDFADPDDDGDGLSDTEELGDPVSPVDTDGDQIPDFRDLDSDGDRIRDQHEQRFDPDMDLIPAFQDPDSDGDCRPDWTEAGDTSLSTPPLDSDGDTRADFIDLDSDNDGLVDGLEDVNCDGEQDPRESSPSVEDTDGDGATDLVEDVAETDPSDPSDNPHANGDFIFEVPYQEPPTPAEDTLDFATDIVQADVFFLMDTTGSMGEEIDGLQTSLDFVISQLAANIPNVAIGVGGFGDFPQDPFGESGDKPFYLLHRVMTVLGDAGLASVQLKVNTLAAQGGIDIPESDWEGLFQVAKGTGVTAGGASVPAFDAATAFPAIPPLGESIGTLGGVGFRTGSLPIVVIMTDAHGHNSDGFPEDVYTFPGAATRGTAISALNEIGVRVIGVVSSDQDYVKAKEDITAAVTATGALVPPSAWGTPGVDRPASCPATQCCTGQSDTGEPPDAMGLCPLTFTINAAGVGLVTSIVKAIKVLTTSTTIDIRADIDDDPNDAVDAVEAFVDRIDANPDAPASCTEGLLTIDSDGDGLLDTFSGIVPGSTVCFNLVPKMNTTIMPTSLPQVYKATIRVTGDDVATLDTREVYFLVRPEVPNPPIE